MYWTCVLDCAYFKEDCCLFVSDVFDAVVHLYIISNVCVKTKSVTVYLHFPAQCWSYNWNELISSYSSLMFSNHPWLYHHSWSYCTLSPVLLNSEVLSVSSACYIKFPDQGVSRMKKFNLSRPALFSTHNAQLRPAVRSISGTTIKTCYAYDRPAKHVMQCLLAIWVTIWPILIGSLAVGKHV